MSAVQFLFDEDVDNSLPDALIQQEPAVVIRWVGGPFAPPKRTSDPDNLKFAEEDHLAVISRDKRTLPPVHVRYHLEAGGHTWGVFLLRSGFPLSRYVDALVLLWAASEAEEWRDRIEWIPW